MHNISFDFNEESIRKKILDAAQKQVQEKLFINGIEGVTVQAIAIKGNEVRFNFSGDDEAVKKAKALFGKA